MGVQQQPTEVAHYQGYTMMNDEGRFQNFNPMNLQCNAIPPPPPSQEKGLAFNPMMNLNCRNEGTTMHMMMENDWGKGNIDDKYEKLMKKMEDVKEHLKKENSEMRQRIQEMHEKLDQVLQKKGKEDDHRGKKTETVLKEKDNMRAPFPNMGIGHKSSGQALNGNPKQHCHQQREMNYTLMGSQKMDWRKNGNGLKSGDKNLGNRWTSMNTGSRWNGIIMDDRRSFDSDFRDGCSTDW